MEELRSCVLVIIKLIENEMINLPDTFRFLQRICDFEVQKSLMGFQGIH